MLIAKDSLKACFGRTVQGKHSQRKIKNNLGGFKKAHCWPRNRTGEDRPGEPQPTHLCTCLLGTF